MLDHCRIAQCASGIPGAKTLGFAPDQPDDRFAMSKTRAKTSVYYNLVWTLTLACVLLATASIGGYAFLATKNPWTIVLAAILIFALALAFVRFWVRLTVALSDAGVPGRKTE